jgi:hypothetical protein
MKTILRTYRAPHSVSVLALIAMITSSAHAGPPVASTDIKSAEKTAGVTLYQASGLTGSIPLKKVFKPDPSGDTGHYELQFASNNMNTKMDILAKYVVPAGQTFKSFEIHTTNGNTQVTPASADTWDGQTISDKVTVSPWNMNRVLQQCVDHLKNGDGTFKDSATFDLEADVTEVIRGNGSATFPNAPPGSASSATGTVRPRTRVTAYIVNADRRASERKPDVEQVDRRASGRKPDVSARVTPQLPRTAPPRLTAPLNPVAAKDRFERTKPHVNAPMRPAAPSVKSRVPQRPAK